MADSTRAARGTDDRRRLADVWSSKQATCGSMPGSLGVRQFTVTDREPGPRWIEDPQRLDEHRAEAGLEPFADYEARMRART